MQVLGVEKDSSSSIEGEHMIVLEDLKRLQNQSDMLAIQFGRCLILLNM